MLTKANANDNDNANANANAGVFCSMDPNWL